MSDVIATIVTELETKMAGNSLDGSAKFLIEGEGAVIVEGSNVRVSDDAEEADVTLTTDPETVQDIMSGDQNPTTAFMTGKLSVDGDMGKAMQLASLLS